MKNGKMRTFFLSLVVFSILFINLSGLVFAGPPTEKKGKAKGHDRTEIIEHFKTWEDCIGNGMIIDAAKKNYFIYAICQTDEERAEGLYFPTYDIQLWVNEEEIPLERIIWRDQEGIKMGESVTWHIYYYIVEPFEFETNVYHYYSIMFTYYHLHPREMHTSYFEGLRFFYADNLAY